MPKGIPFIISAPSGTGKSTVCKKLLERRKDLRFSISCTTRDPRPGERDGKDYHFVAKDEFVRKIERNDFLEWATVHECYYGTPRQFIEETLEKGLHVLLAIDVQGGESLRRKIPESALIFLAPPSIESLKQRLSARQDPSDSVAKRLASSRSELNAAKKYDYFVINDDLEKAVSQIECIITAESLRVSRQPFPDLTPA